jgi:hypothetical protein
MKVTLRSHSAVAWMIWFLHAPLGILWLVTAILAVAGIVSLFFDPQRAVHLGEFVATTLGCVKLVAHVKGIPAWPSFKPGTRDGIEVDSPRHLT